jgi:hypothetical protein
MGHMTFFIIEPTVPSLRIRHIPNYFLISPVVEMVTLKLEALFFGAFFLMSRKLKKMVVPARPPIWPAGVDRPS